MNLIPISYNEVQVNDILFIKTEKEKKGEAVKVVSVERWETKSSYLPDYGLMCKITFENGDEWFGWQTRLLNKVSI
jgi:hypothetical protein